MHTKQEENTSESSTRRFIPLLLLLVLLLSLTTSIVGYILGKNASRPDERRVVDTIILTPPEEVAGKLPLSFYGRVHYTDGTPYANGRVVLHSEPKETVTGEKGDFFFYNVEPGEHEVSIVDEKENTLAALTVKIEQDGTAVDTKLAVADDGRYNLVVAVDVALIEVEIEIDDTDHKMTLKPFLTTVTFGGTVSTPNGEAEPVNGVILTACGTAVLPDHTIAVPDKGLILNDGTYIAADGTVMIGDGTLAADPTPPSGGGLTLPGGQTVMPDGTVVLPDGTTVTPDGEIKIPDGTVVIPGKEVISPDGEVIIPPEGGTVLEPDTQVSGEPEQTEPQTQQEEPRESGGAGGTTPPTETTSPPLPETKESPEHTEGHTVAESQSAPVTPGGSGSGGGGGGGSDRPDRPTKPEEPTLPVEPTTSEEPTLPVEPTTSEEPTPSVEPTTPEESTTDPVDWTDAVVSQNGVSWIQLASVDLLKNNNSALADYLYPGVSGDYEFEISNPNSYALRFTVTMSEERKDAIPFRYQIMTGDKYLTGTEGQWLTADELQTKNVTLGPQEKITYKLNWLWPYEGGKDTLDTNIGLSDEPEHRVKISIFIES